MQRIRPIKEILSRDFFTDDKGLKHSTSEFKEAFKDILEDLNLDKKIENYIMECPGCFAALRDYSEIDKLIFHCLEAKDNLVLSMVRPVLKQKNKTYPLIAMAAMAAKTKMASKIVKCNSVKGHDLLLS